jgi:hypothetical protein
MKKLFLLFGVALFVAIGASGHDRAAAVVSAAALRVLAPNRPFLVERLADATVLEAAAQGSANQVDKTTSKPKQPPPPPPPPPRHKPRSPRRRRDSDDKDKDKDQEA